MSQAVVVSFFTPEWEYRSRAMQLMKDCDKLGIPHDIRARPSLGNWNRNTAMKPQFIRETLYTHQHVIWLDCDGKLYQRPEQCLLHQPETPFKAVTHQTMSAHPVTPRQWHTGLLSVQRSPSSLLITEAWVKVCEEQQITDELGFHLVTSVRPGCVTPLPLNYLRICRNGRAPSDTVYGLGISESPDKLAMKKRQRTKK